MWVQPEDGRGRGQGRGRGGGFGDGGGGGGGRGFGNARKESDPWSAGGEGANTSWGVGDSWGKPAAGKAAPSSAWDAAPAPAEKTMAVDPGAVAPASAWDEVAEKDDGWAKAAQAATGAWGPAGNDSGGWGGKDTRAQTAKDDGGQGAKEGGGWDTKDSSSGCGPKDDGGRGTNDSGAWAPKESTRWGTQTSGGWGGSSTNDGGNGDAAHAASRGGWGNSPLRQTSWRDDAVTANPPMYDSVPPINKGKGKAVDRGPPSPITVRQTERMNPDSSRHRRTSTSPATHQMDVDLPTPTTPKGNWGQSASARGMHSSDVVGARRLDLADSSLANLLKSRSTSTSSTAFNAGRPTHDVYEFYE
jgi:hypothetical protein